MERLLFVGPVEKYFVREMLRGLAMDARFRQAWTILTQAPPGSAAAWQALLQQVQPDAIVAHARLDPDEYRLLQRLGRLAADYFLEHHFHEFAYAGYAGLPVFEQRGAAFRHRLEQAGFPVRTIRIDPVQDTLLPYSGPRTLRLATELRGLPAAPCAVFCGNDAIAALLLELCQREDIRVPHELAVLGVNNDSLLCRLCYPPLSSIRLPYRELGRLAAERLLNWQPDFAREGHVLVLPPNEVVERQSTSLQRISDPVVLRAVDYMVAHLGEAFPMQQLRQCTGVSTPTLMKRFRTHLQMTPIAQLRQLRIQQAKRLLLHPRKELRQVARACGFRRTEHFLATFKQLTGLTVTSYCKQHGPAPAP